MKMARRGPPSLKRSFQRLASLMRALRRQPLPIVVAATSCVLLVGISVKLIDRPVSTWVHNHLGNSRFVWFTAIHDDHPLTIGPFSVMAALSEALWPLAFGVLVVIVCAGATGWQPGRRGRIALVLSLSILFAMDIVVRAQRAFGRTWPETWRGNSPSWIRDGVFGFFPFHGGAGWASFPSGNTTVITTAATVFWIVWPEFRLFWAAAVVVDMVGLIGANYHFVSDVIGGFYLGGAVGLGMAALMLSPKDRRNRAIARPPLPTEQISSPTTQVNPGQTEA